ncbi:MAG: DUF2330 domain-containing protein [Oscillatoriales cyanobacterium C42_A2020_001]|nr:DUF2330 domain-containing protein [Leptolyngbyaceae cyanobacterium C42_A2020_001]
MKLFQTLTISLLVLISSLFVATKAWAFCGFYVAKADANLYNQASQVAIARSGNRTVLTMANDYQGEVKDFAIVVPVPVVLKKEQVEVGSPKAIARLDAFSAPRLVEYFDPDPCAPQVSFERMPLPAAAPQSRRDGAAQRDRNSLGVTIEEKFTVGEYDILILSAKESGGLETWLIENGYKIPQGARDLLRPYIRQKMKFFVAKVNLKEFKQAGYQNLRPIRMTYDSPRFMLPLRLGMVNAKSAQDLLVYVLTPTGQAEVTNYRTVKVPSGNEVPTFVKNEFNAFYKSMFQTSYEREGRNIAFLEYAWDMANCDPCSAEPLSREELKDAGVFWLDQPEVPSPLSSPFRRRPMPTSGVFITRLHVRYTRDKFPEDLMFHATNNRELFQGRYVLRYPFMGEATCSQGKQYVRSLPRRFEQEAQTLAKLTGWNIQDIRNKLPNAQVQSLSWWEQLWLALSGS